MQAFQKPNITFHPTQQNYSEYKFSIVIPTWNNLAMLRLCVESILKNSKYKTIFGDTILSW